jgi:hypothetical protein
MAFLLDVASVVRTLRALSAGLQCSSTNGSGHGSPSAARALSAGSARRKLADALGERSDL